MTPPHGSLSPEGIGAGGIRLPFLAFKNANAKRRLGPLRLCFAF
jgi:hypothetical protein